MADNGFVESETSNANGHGQEDDCENNTDKSRGGLLIIVGDLLEKSQAESISAYVVKALQSWDSEVSKCDINAALGELASADLTGRKNERGECLVETTIGLLNVQIWVNPLLVDFNYALGKFLAKNYEYHFFIFGGLYFAGSGNLIFQDEVCSCDKFLQMMSSHISSQASNENRNIVCFLPTEGAWSKVEQLKETYKLNMTLNPAPRLEEINGLLQFEGYLINLIQPLELGTLLAKSEVVGNIRFSRPTLYVFPAGHGDSVLFGITGFNLLIDGGYEKKPCFWDFVRHLDRIDALLVSHISESNLFGLKYFVERKAFVDDVIYPDIGPILFNAPNKKTTEDDAGADVNNTRKINVATESKKILDAIKKLSYKVSSCTSKSEKTDLIPENLYHKMGQGNLDLFVLNPTNDNKLREYYSHWMKNDASPAGGIPLASSMSVVTLLVWKPASPTENITRLLFPGCIRQSELFTSLEKMRNKAYLQHRDCSEQSLTEKAKPASTVSSLRVGSAFTTKAAATKPSPAGSETEAPAVKRSTARPSTGGLEAKPRPKPALNKTLVATVSDTKTQKNTEKDGAAAGKDVEKQVASTSAADGERKPFSVHTKPKQNLEPKATDRPASRKATGDKVNLTPKPSANKSIPRATSAPKPTDRGSAEAKNAALQEKGLSAKQSEFKSGTVRSSPASSSRTNFAKDKKEAPIKTLPFASKSDRGTTRPGVTKSVDKKKGPGDVSTPNKGGKSVKSSVSSTASSQQPKPNDGAKAGGGVAKEKSASAQTPVAQIVHMESPADTSESVTDSLGTDVDGVHSDLQLDPSPSPGDLPEGLKSQDGLSDDTVVEAHGVMFEGDLGTCVDAKLTSDSPSCVVGAAGDVAGLHTEEDISKFPNYPEDDLNQSNNVQGSQDSTEFTNTCDDLGTASSEPGSEADSLNEPNESDAEELVVGEQEQKETSEASQVLKDWGEPMGLLSPRAPGKENKFSFNFSKQDTKKACGNDTKNTCLKMKPLTKAVPRQRPSSSPVKATGSSKSIGTASGTGSAGGGRRMNTTKSSEQSSRKDAPGTQTKGTGKPGLKPQSKLNPFYVDLTYIPHDGNIINADIEFFQRIRAKYYVLSVPIEQTDVLENIVAAKESWNEGNDPQHVTIVPTYENDPLRMWVTKNLGRLQELSIDVAPSAKRCIIHLQDHDASCAAYRLEF